ncbi:MAG: 23S rRNA (pseudouridine(1915)-N(3))-methyltransferase RlmH [Bacillota bacterium]
MIKLSIVAVGGLKNQEFRALALEYEKRIAPFARLEVIEAAPVPFGRGDKERAKKLENEAIGKVLHNFPKDSIYLLAEGGKQYDSLGFSSFLQRHDGGELVLALGGALGWDKEFAKSYRLLSLSALTFPHELARVILFEQIYRGLSIAAGKEYHY